MKLPHWGAVLRILLLHLEPFLAPFPPFQRAKTSLVARLRFWKGGWTLKKISFLYVCDVAVSRAAREMSRLRRWESWTKISSRIWKQIWFNISPWLKPGFLPQLLDFYLESSQMTCWSSGSWQDLKIEWPAKCNQIRMVPKVPWKP